MLLGKRVSTKAVGYYARNDITDEYKFREGSILERASVKNALLKSKNPAAKITKKGIFACLIRYNVNDLDQIKYIIKVVSTKDLTKIYRDR